MRLCPSQLRARAWWGWSRWALRWRNQDAVRQVADVLGRDAAEYMVRSLVPLDSLSKTIEHAVLDELAVGQLHTAWWSMDRPIDQ